MSSLVVLEQMVMIFILILTGFVLYKKIGYLTALPKICLPW